MYFFIPQVLPTPWRDILLSPIFWSISISNFGRFWIMSVIFLYTPQYLKNIVQIQIDKVSRVFHSCKDTGDNARINFLMECFQNGVYSGIPYIIACAFSLPVSCLADHMIKQRYMTTVGVRLLFTFLCKSYENVWSRFSTTLVDMNFHNLTRSSWHRPFAAARRLYNERLWILNPLHRSIDPIQFQFLWFGRFHRWYCAKFCRYVQTSSLFPHSIFVSIKLRFETWKTTLKSDSYTVVQRFEIHRANESGRGYEINDKTLRMKVNR